MKKPILFVAIVLLGAILGAATTSNTGQMSAQEQMLLLQQQKQRQQALYLSLYQLLPDQGALLLQSEQLIDTSITTITSIQNPQGEKPAPGAYEQSQR